MVSARCDHVARTLSGLPGRCPEGKRTITLSLTAGRYERVYGEKIGAEELADKLQFWGRTRDKDKSGEVTWQEYAESKAMLILDQRNALASALTADEVEDAKRVFNAIDRDGGGSISESEARDFFAARAKKDVENGVPLARS